MSLIERKCYERDNKIIFFMMMPQFGDQISNSYKNSKYCTTLISFIIIYVLYSGTIFPNKSKMI